MATGGFTFTTADLINSIKRRGSVPTTQPLFEDEDFLALANEELQTVIMPMIMSTRGNYFVTNHDQTMTSEVSYAIPGDAIGLRIKDLYWINPTDPLQREIEIIQVNLNDVTNQFSNWWVMGFYIQGNNVILTPQSMPQNTLRMKIYRRASRLVTVDQGGQVTEFNTPDIVLNSVPSDWEVGDSLVLTNQHSPFETISTVEITTISAPSIQVTVTDGAVLSSENLIGNWFTLEGDSVIPQISIEAQPILSQAVVVKCLEALGDPLLEVAQMKFEQIKQNYLNSETPRVDSQAPKIVARNGTLAWGKNWRWGW